MRAGIGRGAWAAAVVAGLSGCTRPAGETALEAAGEVWVSKPAPGAPSADGARRSVDARLFPVIKAAEAYVVLDAEPEDVGLGEPELEAREGISVATRPARPDALPESTRRLEGARVRLYGKAGEACVGRLGALRLVSRFASEPDAGEAPDAEVARTVVAQGSTVLAAAVEGASGRCEGALFARLDGAPAPRLALPGPADAETADRALAAFRALGAYAETQAAYERDVPAPRPRRWDDQEGAVPEVRVMRHGAEVTHVWVSAARRGCEPGAASLAALWRVGPSSELDLLHATADFAIDELLGMVASGEALLFPDRMLVSTGAGRGYATVLLEVPYAGCSC